MKTIAIAIAVAAAALLVIGAPRAAEPPPAVEEPVLDNDDGFTAVLHSMSAEVIIEGELLPELRAQIAAEAPGWHRVALRSLLTLPLCAALVTAGPACLESAVRSDARSQAWLESLGGLGRRSLAAP